MNCKKLAISFLFFFLFSFAAHLNAQTDTTAQVTDFSGVEQVNKVYVEQVAKTAGYRLQLYTGTKQKPAHQIKAKLKTEFPELAVYVIYEQPYFKVRVGNCFTKTDAWRLKNKLAESYPNSFIVKENIEVCPE